MRGGGEGRTWGGGGVQKCGATHRRLAPLSVPLHPVSVGAAMLSAQSGDVPGSVLTVPPEAVRGGVVVPGTTPPFSVHPLRGDR